MFGSRQKALQRATKLSEQGPRKLSVEQVLGALDSEATVFEASVSDDEVIIEEEKTAAEYISVALGELRKLLKDNGFTPSLFGLFVTSLLFVAFGFFLLSLILTPVISAAIALAGGFLPFAFLQAKKRKKAILFAKDYPTVLMATASSIKAGLTPQLALERATELLPSTSMVKKEVDLMLDRIRSGCPKDVAVKRFAEELEEPEISLFRSALLLAERNGGKFAPTLERLAQVCQDRSNLVSEARVSSATMRMTGNFLLFICPVILLVISFRTENFWQIITENPTANLLASIGLVLIFGGYFCLRRMSDFRP